MWWSEMRKLIIIEDLGERGYLVENAKRTIKNKLSNKQLIESLKYFEIENETENNIILFDINLEDYENEYDVIVDKITFYAYSSTSIEDTKYDKTYKSLKRAENYYNKLLKELC